MARSVRAVAPFSDGRVRPRSSSSARPPRVWAAPAGGLRSRAADSPALTGPESSFPSVLDPGAARPRCEDDEKARPHVGLPSDANADTALDDPSRLLAECVLRRGDCGFRRRCTSGGIGGLWADSTLNGRRISRSIGGSRGLGECPPSLWRPAQSGEHTGWRCAVDVVLLMRLFGGGRRRTGSSSRARGRGVLSTTVAGLVSGAGRRVPPGVGLSPGRASTTSAGSLRSPGRTAARAFRVAEPRGPTMVRCGDRDVTVDGDVASTVVGCHVLQMPSWTICERGRAVVTVRAIRLHGFASRGNAVGA